MDAQRKAAYRWLLYKAMLDIRPLQWTTLGWREHLNPKAWRDYVERVKCAGAIADWLHNLAIFSALDFANFDERQFWNTYEYYVAKYPSFRFSTYRDEFDRNLQSADEDSP